MIVHLGRCYCVLSTIRTDTDNRVRGTRTGRVTKCRTLLCSLAHLLACTYCFSPYPVGLLRTTISSRVQITIYELLPFIFLKLSTKYSKAVNLICRR